MSNSNGMMKAAAAASVLALGTGAYSLIRADGPCAPYQYAACDSACSQYLGPATACYVIGGGLLSCYCANGLNIYTNYS